MPGTATSLLDTISEQVHALEQQLRALSLDIHAHPELAFEEHHAVQALTMLLEREGFAIETPLGGLDTAFRASLDIGNGDGPTIALIAEYDALPGLGHACGHNLICAAATGAAIALQRSLAGRGSGRIQVIGTPAEEGGGGKILLLDKGVFAGVDAAMMFHGGARTMTTRGSLAATRVTMGFHGRAAHAASYPHQGINALDACIQTFNAINSLRQHVRDETRIHGIITDGGAAANIVPAYAEAKFIIRHRSFEYAQEVKERIFECARHAAASVGATVELTEGLAYTERKTNQALAARFGEYLEASGESVKAPPATGGVGSSDFNNLSNAVPAIHPYIAIAPEGTSAHTPEFAEAASSPAGQRAMLLAARCLAATAADLLTDPDFLNEVRSEFAGNQDDPA